MNCGKTGSMFVSSQMPDGQLKTRPVDCHNVAGTKISRFFVV